MDVGAFSFREFKELVEQFHGYAAPGVLIGGYMVEAAKSALPEKILFEAMVETQKCLPDAVQLLTLCSTGNNRLKIRNIGKYAVSLFDKYTGLGVRVHIDMEKLHNFPEIFCWFLKKKAKKEQNESRLLYEIEKAGFSICTVQSIRIHEQYLGRISGGVVNVCPVCGEAYPADDGEVCRGCKGESPWSPIISKPDKPVISREKIVPLEEAIGQRAFHDMTQIVPGFFKGPVVRAGQLLGAGDLCKLQQMGRFHIAVEDEGMCDVSYIHENKAAEAFAKKIAGPGVDWQLPPKEGKITFTANHDGLFSVNRERLLAFNLVPEVMVATLHDAVFVQKGDALAGTRIIPLCINREHFSQALEILDHGPLFSVMPMRHAKVGILVTGTEVFRGIIEDRFIPIIKEKVEALRCTVVTSVIVPDSLEDIKDAVQKIQESGADFLITTAGLSVDPDDVTRQALMESGLEHFLYGVPVLPGTMSLVGMIGNMQVLGVPACALYYKTTFLDLALPRMLAGRECSRVELAHLGEGGFCRACSSCVWPDCAFGK